MWDKRDKLRKKISYVFFTIYFKPQFNHWKSGTELVVPWSFSRGSCFWAFVLRVGFGYWATMPAPVFKVELWFPFYHVAWILGFKPFLLFCRGFGIQCGIDECGMAFKTPGTKKTTLANLVIGYRRLICGIFILFRYSLTKNKDKVLIPFSLKLFQVSLHPYSIEWILNLDVCT